MNIYQRDEAEVEEIDEQLVIEEYKIWKKNAPFMYDTMITHVLEWPSLTVEWASGRECSPNSDFSLQTLLLGTNTGASEQEYLLQAKVKIPMEQSLISGKVYLDNTKDAGGIGLLSKADNKIELSSRVSHEREVVKARMQPKQEFVVASKSSNGQVFIYDMRKYTSKSTLVPYLTLIGHSKEGKGLAWSPAKSGILASGSMDNITNIWDVSSGNCSPLRTFVGHEAGVEDISFNETGSLASVGNDKKIFLWDLRQESPTHSIEAHSRELTCCDFNPTSPLLLATGSKDKTIAVWDLRNLSLKIASLNYHKDIVTSVKWGPMNSNLIASAGCDRRVMVWDIARIGRSLTEEELEDGPPELVFIHGGHTSWVSDIAWNGNEDLTLASVAEDNILQVWQMSSAIFNY